MSMTLSQIHKLVVELGIKNDLRGPVAVKRHLRRQKERHDGLSSRDKQDFDQENLWNPYSDARVYYGEPNRVVKRVAMGIDVEVSELLLAHELSEKGKKIDAVITHHPVGAALAGLHEVMHLQAEVLAKYGVPINVAENLMHPRIDEISRKTSPINHQREIDAARLLDVPFLSVHTPTDNMVAMYLYNLVTKNAKKLELVKDVLNLLRDIPEYKEARKWKAGPRLFAGSPERFAGKIAVTEITGGTEGAPEVYEKLSQAGIGTVIGMHMSEKHKEAAEKAHMNAIVAGHMSSDSLGMNLFADELQKRGVEIVAFGGFIRVSRVGRAKKPASKTKKRR